MNAISRSDVLPAIGGGTGTQTTSQSNTQYLDSDLTIIGLRLSDINPSSTYNFKLGSDFISVRLKKNVAIDDTLITSNNYLTFFDLRSPQGGGSGGGGGLSTIAYHSQFEFIDNLTAGFNLSQLIEGSLIITKNRTLGTLEEVKLYKLAGTHNTNTITLRIKDIGANESTSDTILATFTTTSGSANTLTATIDSTNIASDKQLYIHATNENSNMQFIITVKYNG